MPDAITHPNYVVLTVAPSCSSVHEEAWSDSQQSLIICNLYGYIVSHLLHFHPEDNSKLNFIKTSTLKFF